MSGVISTRNGVPPEASDPPGGIPRTPDPDTHPHPAPAESEPAPEPATDLPENEPPQVPPRREAAVHVTRTTTVHASRTHPQQRHK